MAKKQVYNKARYDRQKQNEEWVAGRTEYQRQLYNRKKLDPEWVAAQAEKRHKKQQDPEWAERRREAKRRYDESVQNDPEKRKKRNRTVNEWRRKKAAQQPAKDKVDTIKVKNPCKIMLSGAKTRARHLGLEFKLDESDIVIPSMCPVLGIPIAPFQAIKNRDNSVSLDRINPNKGYTADNVQVVSMLCNRLKSNCTDPAVFRKIADYIEANLKR